MIDLLCMELLSFLGELNWKHCCNRMAVMMFRGRSYNLRNHGLFVIDKVQQDRIVNRYIG